jgi:hypothetical protein
MPHLIQQLLPYLPWVAFAASLVGPIVSAMLSTLLTPVVGSSSDANNRRGIVSAGAVAGV